MKWAQEIEAGIFEKIPQVIQAKIAAIRKAETKEGGRGYFFDLHIKLVSGRRGTCHELFIDSDFIKYVPSSEIADIFVKIVKDEICRELDKPAKKDTMGVKDGR